MTLTRCVSQPVIHCNHGVGKRFGASQKVSNVPNTIESNLKYRPEYEYLIATDKDNIDVVTKLIKCFADHAVTGYLENTGIGKRFNSTKVLSWGKITKGLKKVAQWNKYVDSEISHLGRVRLVQISITSTIEKLYS